MIIAIEGGKGSGKSALMAEFLRREEREGLPIYASMTLYFPSTRFHFLHEIFGLLNCAIGIDEGQKFFSCRRFMSFPEQFAEMVAGDRHDYVKIYATTQNITHIDRRVRDNIDLAYRIVRIFRFPFSEKRPAMIQICRYYQLHKKWTPSGEARFVSPHLGKWFIISKYKKKLYETHEKISLSRYIWKIKTKKGKPTLRIIARTLVDAGKKRM